MNIFSLNGKEYDLDNPKDRSRIAAIYEKYYGQYSRFTQAIMYRVRPLDDITLDLDDNG